MLLRTITFLTISGAAYAQLSGPVMGYLPDGSSLRAINGIPAASSVGPAVSGNRNLAQIQVAPGQALALATADDNGQLVVATLDANGQTLQLTPVSGAAAGANTIVFSPNGSAAATWVSSTGHLQILTGLTSTASTTVAVQDIDAAFAGGEPTAIAVSDDGQWAIGSFGGNNYAFGPGSQVITLPVSGYAEAINFFHGKSDAAIMTGTQVVTIADIGGAAATTVLWSLPADAPRNQPVAVGIAASADNAKLTIAADSGALFTFDMATGAGTPADCDCKPSGLSGVGGSVFRLNGVSAGVLKLFDAASNSVWFVPLGANVVSGGQQ